MFRKLFFFLLGIGTFFSALIYLLGSTGLPSADQIKGCITTKLYQVELCPGSKDYVPLNKISSYLKKTIILTEDSSFFQHHGFDWGAIEKNAREGWEKGSFKKGGSTITQQLAKNMFLSKDRTFARKLMEALITDRIEHTLNKNEILERYFNVIEFGKNLYGVKAAAQFYFQKSPAELDIVESAFLAMLLPNPVKYSKSFHSKEMTPFARERVNQIVEKLFQYKRITPEEYLTATEKLATFLQPSATTNTTEPALEEELSIEDGAEEESNW